MDGRHIRLSHLKQRHGAAFQLSGRLDKITAVGPQSRHVLRHDRRPCGTSKTCNVFPAFKMLAYVLRCMKIIRRNEVDINLFFFHQGTQRSQTFRYTIAHMNTSFPLSNINPVTAPIIAKPKRKYQNCPGFSLPGK